MPLGAARLNTIARYVATSGGGGGEAVYSLTNTEFNASAYTNNRLSYAGDDSSGQPVFYYAYDNGSGDFEGSLLKINNDSTVSETVITYHSTDTVYDGQGVVGYAGNGSPCVVANMVYNNGAIRNKAFANIIDLDALSFGTTYSLNDWEAATPNAGITSVQYGNSNGWFFINYRNSGSRVESFYFGPGLGDNNVEKQLSAIGDGVWQNLGDEIFYDTTYSQFCWMVSNGNANQSTFGKHKSTYGYNAGGTLTVDNISVGLAQTEMFLLNNTTSLTVAAKDAAAQAVAHSINWGTSYSTAPSVTAGSTLTFTDSSSWNEGFACAVDKGTETAYVLYNDGTDWKTTSITHSGTALTEGTPSAVGVTTTNWNPCTSNAACVADSAQGLLFVALIDDSTTANPQLYVKPLE